MNNKSILNESTEKNSKKKGFTLLELIAVIAIIAILATSILPKVTGYINEAKKTKVIDQCRKVVMAVESYNLKQTTDYSKTNTISKAKEEKGISKYLEGVELTNLYENKTTVQHCYDILNGKEFDIEKGTEKLKIDTVSRSVSSSVIN